MVCGLSLTGFTPVEKEQGTQSEQGSLKSCTGSQGNRADHIFRVTCSWGADNRCPEMSLSLGMESASSKKGISQDFGHPFLDSPQNGLEKNGCCK